MRTPTVVSHRGDMDPTADVVYLLSGATRAGDAIGPIFAVGLDAHALARRSLAPIGGTVRLLRPSDDGWREVARYTDGGQYPHPSNVWVEVLP